MERTYGHWRPKLLSRARGFRCFATALRALEVHASVNANWADNYTYNNSMYVATGSAVCTNNAYVSIVENIITLEKEDNLD